MKKTLNMFPFATCMRYKPDQEWKIVEFGKDKTKADPSEVVSINIDDQNAMFIRLVGPIESSPLTNCFTKEDWVLLDAMGSNPGVGGCSGRFLTMHKRRRKKLATRSLQQDHAILDDIHHGQVQHILARCGLWGFNAFTLETVAGGRALPVLCVHLFHWYGLLDYFQLDVVRVWKLFTLIEEGYHSTNPYHNSIHATDVTQAMHCFLQEEKIRKHLKPLEVMAALIGAVAHDLDHPGVNQHFLICTSNHLATLYQNMSVLENHHWRSAVGCLLESGVAEQVLPYRADLEQQIRDLILATDINRQQEFLNKFKTYLDTDTLDLSRTIDRHFILQIALKCADISNPTRPWDISHKWSIKVCDEFFRQGEFERKLNLPVTSICDQQSTSVAKIQVGFFRFVVTPLFSEWHRFLRSALSTQMMRILDANRQRWERHETAEAAEETRTELSDAADDDPPTTDEDDDRRSPVAHPLFAPAAPPARRQSLAVPAAAGAPGARRHSVPVGLPAAGRDSPDSRASSALRDELRFGSASSLRSSGCPSSEELPERPLSAENLLPEPSIASMTSSSAAAASRLSSVLQAGTAVAPPSKCLQRQQTFPPPQPYVRMRYMSATVEMSTCAETVHEDDDADDVRFVERMQETTPPPSYQIPSIAVLSPNNGQAGGEFGEGAGDRPQGGAAGGNKREVGDGGGGDGRVKMVKLSNPMGQKENMDPKRALARRRGSAPVTLPLADEFGTPAGGGVVFGDALALRRGSVPIEVAHYYSFSYDDENQESVINITPVETSRTFWQYQRRGSAPVDLPPPGTTHHLLTRHTSLNGKAGGGRRKKQPAQLRRRSSGGPETVCLPHSATDSDAAWTKFMCMRRATEIPDALLARRRGSLPIEVLTVGHSVF